MKNEDIITIRELFMDNPAFSSYDLYLTEYVLRNITSVLIDYVASLLSCEQTIMCAVDEKNSLPARCLVLTNKALVDTTEAVKRGEAESPSTLGISELSIARLLATDENNKLTPFFMRCYSAAATQNYITFEARVLQSLLSNPDAAWFIDHITKLFGDNKLPTHAEVEAVQLELNRRIQLRLQSPIASQTPSANLNISNSPDGRLLN